MMRHAFIFHGTEGYPEENWFPWLKMEMETLGMAVHVPQFPTPENQTLEAWFDVLRNYEQHIDEKSILVGHSLGGAFLLRVLEHIRTKIAFACLVATPIGIPPIQNDAGDQPFIGHPFDWKKIREHAQHFVVFHSNNDPLVSLGNGKELARKLRVELMLIPNAGHFNTKAGYVRFDALLEEIKKVLS